MSLEVQFRIKKNPYYVSYLRNNSYWYKILTRNPSEIDNFEQKAKEFYKLRKSDRISKTLEYIELFQTIMSSLK